MTEVKMSSMLEMPLKLGERMGLMNWLSGYDYVKDLHAAESITRGVVNKNMETLLQLRNKGLKAKSSTDYDASKWIKDAWKFFGKSVLPLLNSNHEKAINEFGLEKFATKNIEEVVQMEASRRNKVSMLKQSQAVKNISQKTMTGVQYEQYCANLLSKAGWQCETTKASGDQGVDVIAKRDGKVLVVQCKKYSSSVGNAAVQQILAAKLHTRADYAAVITNSTYTKSANELAESTGVMLLNHDEINQINRRISLII